MGALYEEVSTPLEDLSRTEAFVGQWRPVIGQPLAEEEAESLHRGPMVLIGKSMGSRLGCHMSLVDEVQAVVCLGYPLCGGGDPAKLRDKVLPDMSVPILFVQGSPRVLFTGFVRSRFRPAGNPAQP